MLALNEEPIWLAVRSQNLARVTFRLIQPSQRFWLLLSMQTVFELSVAPTH